ncbi:type VI secretion system contractile sheath large subunit [Polyangium aurulentum]|uniref:type VI secretion system contractile sheath large subunit n=1 Tax=Polyangium aurulentum TaxID=2567896 RepID=UPI0010AE2165|nr:type VI secretion system contractile sheath large subunit [Polyangium aurulentum]UQA56298.1 type VI secretion system contractile sheath large subunit [Polyangium aurulentum]
MPDNQNAAKTELDSSAKELQSKLLGPIGADRTQIVEAGTSTPIQLMRTLALPAPSNDQGGAGEAATAVYTPLPLLFSDQDPDTNEGVRLMNALAALLVNMPEGQVPATYADLFLKINEVTAQVDEEVKACLDAILHDDEFKTLEANWTTLNELASNVTSDDVIIDFLDLTKDELRTDLDDNQLDIFGSGLFTKIYVEEYDRYGGRPFATMIGLYDFQSSTDDIDFLRRMSKICAAAHCPFIASVDATFFRQKSMQDLAAITDLDAVMTHPTMGKWNDFRNDDFAAYIGLTLPRYVARLPWDGADENQADRNKRFNKIGYVETVHPGQPGDANNFLWGSSAILFAKNIVRAYENSGWAQHIRGPRGGGLVEGLTAYTWKTPDGKDALQPPVEIAIPDYREYQFARNGLIPLVQKKGEATATFFSAQSVKRPKEYIEDLNTQNAHLVTNLAYTFSVALIAHYVKATMREYIGSTADEIYIQQTLSSWLGSFVTTVVNPDDLTLLYYPFKATKVEVSKKPGAFGWYTATISVLPHAQFEGMDVEMRLEAALGGKS